jgi:hypothetical protein
MIRYRIDHGHRGGRPRDKPMGRKKETGAWSDHNIHVFNISHEGCISLRPFGGKRPLPFHRKILLHTSRKDSDNNVTFHRKNTGP